MAKKQPYLVAVLARCRYLSPSYVAALLYFRKERFATYERIVKLSPDSTTYTADAVEGAVKRLFLECDSLAEDITVSMVDMFELPGLQMSTEPALDPPWSPDAAT